MASSTHAAGRTPTKMFIRIQLSRDFSGVTAGKLDHLLYCIHKNNNFQSYNCSLAVGFSDLSTGSTGPASKPTTGSAGSKGSTSDSATASNSTGIFYCRTAPNYKENHTDDEDLFKSKVKSTVMVELYITETPPPTKMTAFGKILQDLINTQLLNSPKPTPEFCFMHFIAELKPNPKHT